MVEQNKSNNEYYYLKDKNVDIIMMNKKKLKKIV